MYVLVYFSFTQHNVFMVYSCYGMYQYFIPFYNFLFYFLSAYHICIGVNIMTFT
jgi:hypothetical protein